METRRDRDDEESNFRENSDVVCYAFTIDLHENFTNTCTCE